jgi:NAD-reducing hydrogenase large subunit
MNEAVRTVAREELSGREITEPLLSRIETAVRAYDPCLSCATHALGQMPLVVSLQREDGGELDRVVRDGDGQVRRLPPDSA